MNIMTLLRGVFFAVTLALVSGCSPEGVAFTATAFNHGEKPYSIHNTAGPALLSEEWRLDNFYTDRRGRLVRKETRAYRSKMFFDTDGDGKGDTSELIFDADLRYVHNETGAVLWVSTFPISQTESQLDLRVVAEGIEQHESGAFVVGYGAAARYATNLLSLKKVSVGGVPAVEVTYERGNVEQMELAKDKRVSTERLLILRPPFQWSHKQHRFPVLMVIGLHSSPMDFEKLVDTQAALVNAIDFESALSSLRPGEASARACFAERPLPIMLHIRADGTLRRVHVPRLATGGPSAYHAESRCLASAWQAATFPVRRGAYEVPIQLPLPPPLKRGGYVPSPVPGPESDEKVKPPPDDSAGESPPEAPPEPAKSEPSEAQLAAEATLRKQLDEMAADLLQCSGTESTVVNVAYSPEAVVLSLRGDKAGSDEEGCMRHVTRRIPVPTGASGTLVHLLQKSAEPSPSATP